MFTFANNASGHGVIEAQCAHSHEITINSKVLVSATEVSIWNPEGISVPFMGAASVQILNVVPKPDEGYVLVRLNILWDSDLIVRIGGVVFP